MDDCTGNKLHKRWFHQPVDMPLCQVIEKAAMPIVPQLDKCLKFMALYLPEQTLILKYV